MRSYMMNLIGHALPQNLSVCDCFDVLEMDQCWSMDDISFSDEYKDIENLARFQSSSLPNLT